MKHLECFLQLISWRKITGCTKGETIHFASLVVTEGWQWQPTFYQFPKCFTFLIGLPFASGMLRLFRFLPFAKHPWKVHSDSNRMFIFLSSILYSCTFIYSTPLKTHIELHRSLVITQFFQEHCKNCIFQPLNISGFRMLVFFSFSGV